MPGDTWLVDRAGTVALRKDPVLSKLSLYDLVGDLVVYRNLDPVDPRLPRFAEAWAEMGLSTPQRPRKLEPAYAQALIWLLQRARALDRPDVTLAELLFIGDTALGDTTAFHNLRAVSGWRGWAFIGSERDGEVSLSEHDGVYVASHWSALAGFISEVLSQGATLGPCTAVVLDIDKTALGARGRNHVPIDRARIAAVEATVADALGDGYNQEAFRRAYAVLNDPQYHYFTADNQDNLAYICIMLGAEVLTLEDLLADLGAGRLTSFREFMARVDAARVSLPNPGLQALHDDIYARVQAGDPTPFKAFRRREFLETVQRMGHLPEDTPLAQRLKEEICLTREVVEVVQWLRHRGCLVMALSDKPDEATMPTAETAAQGYLPLHRVPTHVAGPSIAAMLPSISS